MPEMTTTEAAAYLASRGFEVSRGRVGGRGAPSGDTIKRWCLTGKLKARKSGWVWLVEKSELDKLVEAKQS